jgi:iron transport multicopper oxidase
VGIIGTPVIDPNTEIAYFYVKTYIPNYRAPGDTGVINGVYYFYAVDVKTLDDVPGFPILVGGVPADNDPRKYSIGGVILQRPSLLQVGNFVYAGFGGQSSLLAIVRYLSNLIQATAIFTTTPEPFLVLMS